MVCLKYKNLYVFLILVLSILIIFIGCTTEQKYPPIDNTDTNKDDEEWNINDKDSPSYDFDSLYQFEDVPELNKLFVNASFIKQVIFNHNPYLHGFSSDGRYAALIDFNDKNEIGYLVKIIETFTGDIVYSILIPNSDMIMESSELALAQEALEKGFKIDVPPWKIPFENGLLYEYGEENWYIFKDENDGVFYIKLVNEGTKNEWLIRINKDIIKAPINIDLFFSSGTPELITFVFYNAGLNPIFLHLDGLTNRNSLNGIEKEADRWLYGGFRFIYNQWTNINNKGFIAVSSKEGTGEVQNFIDQWIYLDPSGKMKWYGNSQGIFNSEVKPIQPFDRLFLYRVNLITDSSNSSLQYFIVDQLDQKTKKVIRTIEFKWDSNILEMIPIKTINTYS